MVSADELLDAVFRNLLKNAIQHNRQETPGIWVSVDCLDETVEIRIADNGLGVDDAHKETIFGKGKQGLDSDGTGIGLYLVQSLVDRYGGDVWVEDRNPRVPQVISYRPPPMSRLGRSLSFNLLYTSEENATIATSWDAENHIEERSRFDPWIKTNRCFIATE